MKSAAKKLCAEAERLGYVHDRTNSKGFLIYVGPNGHEVQISPSGDEHQARAISKAMRKATGTFVAPVGRSGEVVKGRQAKRRELDAERLAAEFRQNQADRDAYLARIQSAPLLGSDPKVIRWLEENERQRLEIEVLMRSIPAGGDHQGRRSARHTSGERSAS